MFSQVYYLLRSKTDGNYLVANLDNQENAKTSQYLLLFNENFDALSYLNTHGGNDIRDRFAVESIAGNQLGNLLQRWGFKGVGIVQDPLLPKVDFLTKN